MAYKSGWQDKEWHEFVSQQVQVHPSTGRSATHVLVNKEAYDILQRVIHQDMAYSSPPVFRYYGASIVVMGSEFELFYREDEPLFIVVDSREPGVRGVSVLGRWKNPQNGETRYSFHTESTS